MASAAKNYREYKRALKFSFRIGAAVAEAEARGDATVFKNILKDRLDTFRITGIARPLLLAIGAELGEEWEPTGEWADRIAGLEL